jgi:hypothetical protein
MMLGRDDLYERSRDLKITRTDTETIKAPEDCAVALDLTSRGVECDGLDHSDGTATD